jgi:hypothetical protein
MERMDRNIDLEGSDVIVNTLTSDLGVTVTAGGLGVTAGGLVVTAGNVGVTAGNLEVTAGNLVVTAGITYLKGAGGIVRYQGAPTALVDSVAAITAAMIKTGICTLTPGAAVSKPTDTGGDLCTGLGLGANGDSFDFSIINAATVGGRNITLTDAASNVTEIIGNPIVAARDDTDDAISSGVGRFRVRRTSEGVVTIYRIG